MSIEQVWDSNYDSTWEEEEEEEDEPPKRKKMDNQNNYRGCPARDMQNYRRNYPDSHMPNLFFYRNEIPFEPYGDYIDNIHELWRDDYVMLEENHNFIQWLFPIQEHGMNRCASPVTMKEIQLMKKNKKVMERFLESYKLMLGFYGIVLLDADTGKVGRAKGKWKDRFDNLNRHTHNNLRITRILKCLGEMGFEKFQAPLVRFFLEETLCNDNLPKVKESALAYFMFTVKDKKERQKLVHFAFTNYKPQDKFIWGPVDKLQKMYVSQNGELIYDPPGQRIDARDYCVEVKKSREPESKRNMLVWTFLGYISNFFLDIYRPFRQWFGFFFTPFGLLFRGFIFFGGFILFRGKAKNEKRLNEEGTKNEQIMVNIPEVSKNGAEGKSEVEGLLEDCESQRKNNAELRELDVSTDGTSDDSMKKIKKEDKLETKDNKHERLPDDSEENRKSDPRANVSLNLETKKRVNEPIDGCKETVDSEIYKEENKQEEDRTMKNINIPQIRQQKIDNDTENEDDFIAVTKNSPLNNVMKLDDMASENKRLDRAEGGTEMEDSHTENDWTKDSGADSEDREDEQVQITNGGNQSGKTKTEDEATSKVEQLPPFIGDGDDADETKISRKEGNMKSVTVQSEDIDKGNIGTQNIFPTQEDEGAAKDVEHRVVERDENTRVPQGTGDDTENEDDARSSQGKSVMKLDEGMDLENNRLEGAEGGSEKEDSHLENGEDSDGCTKESGTDSPNEDSEDEEAQITNGGNQSGETKTEDEVASKVEQFPPFVGDGDKADEAKIRKEGSNKNTSTEGIDEEDIGTQSTFSETQKTEQVERDDGETQAEAAKDVEPLIQCVGEGNEDENSQVHKTKDNRGALNVVSKDNEGDIIGAHSTQSEKDLRVDPKADLSLNLETKKGVNEPLDGSKETVDSDSYKEDVKQDGYRTVKDISIPNIRQGKGDDNDTENKDDAGKDTKNSQVTNVMKLDEDMASENKRLEGTEGGTKKEDSDTENGEDSDGCTKDGSRRL